MGRRVGRLTIGRVLAVERAAFEEQGRVAGVELIGAAVAGRITIAVAVDNGEIERRPRLGPRAAQRKTRIRAPVYVHGMERLLALDLEQPGIAGDVADRPGR